MCGVVLLRNEFSLFCYTSVLIVGCFVHVVPGRWTVLVLRASLSWSGRWLQNEGVDWQWMCLRDDAEFPPPPLLLSFPCVSIAVPPSQVKNSWGAEWGANGYILLEREGPEVGGECGILMQASYPVLA